MIKLHFNAFKHNDFSIKNMTSLLTASGASRSTTLKEEKTTRNCNSKNSCFFRANDFDPEDTIAFLIATSGTTGLPKAAAVTHKNIVVSSPYLW